VVVRRTLIVGGGPAGMVAAVALGRAGVACELVEIDAGLVARGRRHRPAEPTATRAQVIWRIAARRPRALGRYTMMVGAGTRIGLVPLSDEAIYLWMLESTSTPQRPPGDELLSAFQERLAPYGGVVGEIAEQISAPEQVDFR
jgi:predicted NAD/FAD-dependent oxidoreductase